MKAKTSWSLLVIVLLGGLVGFAAGSAQADQRQLVQQLLSENVNIRNRALEAVRELGPQKTGIELKVALVTLLEREAQAHVRAYQTGRSGGPVDFPEEPELIGYITRVIVPLQDARFIPRLAAALGTGMTIVRALVEFGEAAAPAVLSMAESPSSTHYQVDGALTTLRLIGGADTKAIGDHARAHATGSCATSQWEAVLHDPLARYRPCDRSRGSGATSDRRDIGFRRDSCYGQRSRQTRHH